MALHPHGVGRWRQVSYTHRKQRVCRTCISRALRLYVSNTFLGCGLQVHASCHVSTSMPGSQTGPALAPAATASKERRAAAPPQQLCAFSVPQHLACESVDRQVDALMSRLRGACRSCHNSRCDGRSSNMGVAVWSDPELSIAAVGPTPIML
jgi:hypothetical protein